MNLLLCAALVAAPAAELSPSTTQPAAAARIITLTEMFSIADQHNLDVVILREKLVQADAALGKAWSGLLPQIQAIGTYTRNSDEAILPFADPTAGYVATPLGPPAPANSELLIPNRVQQIVIQPRNQYVGIAQASVPLVVMPAYWGLAAAHRAMDLNAWSLTHARNELYFGIAQVYFGAVAAARVTDLADKQLDAARAQERVANARYEAGDLPRVGFLRAGVERARAEQDLRRAQNAHVSAKLVLATLVGIDGEFEVTEPAPAEPPAGTEAELVDQALRDRKDLRAAQAGVSAADSMLTATWWKFAPMLSVNGQYRWTNFTGFTGKNDAWLVTLTAVMNLYDGGLRFAEIEEARSKLRESRAMLEKVERTAKQDVRTALLDLESARANLTKAREQQRLAEEGARLVDEQFKAGTATHLDVIDATNARFAAGIAAVSESLNVQLAAIKLAKSVGAFGIEKLAAAD